LWYSREALGVPAPRASKYTRRVQLPMTDILYHKCSGCGKKGILGIDFWWNGSSPRSKCKDCLRDKNHQYYINNSDVIKANARTWKTENVNRVIELRQAEDQKEKARQRTNRWRKNNPEKAANNDRLKRERDPERYQGYVKDWEARNPEKARQLRLDISGRRRARIRNNGFEKVDFLKILIRFGLVCHICNQEIINDLEFDHVIPIAKGGSHTQDNIKPSHRYCNRKKSSKLQYEL
jgi:5-methylcytosine-specific restriction endonuclease McrA